MTEQDFDLAGLLGAHENDPVPAGLRATALTRTLAVQRRRRRRRLAAGALLGAALFLGGALLGPRLGFGVEAPAPEGKPATEGSEEPLDPAALVRAVDRAPLERHPQLMRRAGDLYLAGTEDFEAAVHCYARALDMMSPQDRRRLDPNDTWLLKALKLADD